MPKLIGVTAFAGLLLILAACSQEKPEDGEELSKVVLGRVAGEEFTVADLEKKLKYQFRSQLEGLTGPQAAVQYREIVLSALDELCWVKLGETKGYTNDPEFLDTWELSRRYILARRTIDHEVRAYSEPTEEEIRAYYDENPKEFVIPLRVRLAHVQVATKREAEAVKARLERGEAIEKVAADVSTDARTKEKGGVLGWVTATSGIGHLGMVKEINAVAIKMQPGDVSSPIRLPADRGWTVLYVLERSEEGPRPLDDTLVDAIRERVRTKKHNERFRQLLSQLKEEYDYEFDEESYDQYAASLLTEEELFIMAQRQKLPDQEVATYRRVLRHYPDGAYAAQAQFMIGFVLADELKEYEQARTEFETFLESYPDHELVESARWMLDNMDKPNPDIKELKEVRRKAYSGPS